MTLNKETLNKYLSYLLIFLLPIINFYLFESFTHNAFTTMKLPIQLLNYLLFELLACLFFFIFGKIQIALMIETGLFCIIGLANYFVLQFRSAPIMPWDIFSIRTAASVADNFKYTVGKNTILTILCYIILFIVSSRIRLHRKWNVKIRILGIVISCVLINGFTLYVQQPTTVRTFRLYDKLFTPTVMSKRDGTAVAFLMELQYLTVKKPSPYQENEITSLLDSYDNSNASSFSIADAPNIIVIMDEAFSDLSILGDFTTNEDYMPYLHRLQEQQINTITGNLNVSVLGGNTANTEFEFLTGNSMAFLPQGSIPYQQYITTAIDSLPSHLKSLGYTTVGMHPYHANGWERNRVYPLLGLDTNYFENDFTKPLLIRKYISDESDFEKIKEIYENKEEGKPLFLFNVTMQNHSSYSDSFDNFTPEILVDGVNNPSLTNYLSLIKLSDKALEELIQYFDAQNERTIIVFFGDHQPANSVVEPILRLNGKSNDTLSSDELNLRYKVPYLIWANYDISTTTTIETSANFLGAEVLSIAGLPLSSYQSYLLDLQKKYPVITSMQAMDCNSNSSPVEDLSKELNEYQQIQYYKLFKNR